MNGGTSPVPTEKVKVASGGRCTNLRSNGVAGVQSPAARPSAPSRVRKPSPNLSGPCTEISEKRARQGARETKKRTRPTGGPCHGRGFEAVAAPSSATDAHPGLWHAGPCHGRGSEAVATPGPATTTDLHQPKAGPRRSTSHTKRRSPLCSDASALITTCCTCCRSLSRLPVRPPDRTRRRWPASRRSDHPRRLRLP